MSNVEPLTGIDVSNGTNIATMPAHIATFRGRDTAQDAQHAGLSAAIGTGDPQGGARLQLEVDPPKQSVLTADVAYLMSTQCYCVFHVSSLWKSAIAARSWTVLSLERMGVCVPSRAFYLTDFRNTPTFLDSDD